MIRSVKLLICTSAFFLMNMPVSFSAESAYTGNQRFLPLPQRTTATAQRSIGNSQQKFFPLSASRFPMPLRKEAPAPTPTENFEKKSKSDKNDSMSQEQAKQILSIFAEAN